MAVTSNQRGGGTWPPRSRATLVAAVAVVATMIAVWQLRVVAPPVRLPQDVQFWNGVLTDLHWPGWQATVDGAPVDILRANYLFRAVALAPGTHEVRFRYVATRVGVGAVVSLLTLGALSMLWRRERSRPSLPERAST